MFAQQSLNAGRKDALIKGLSLLPPHFALTPTNGDKIPYRTGWQQESPIPRTVIASDIRTGKAKGYGLRTGEVSNGILAVDIDGHLASALLQELSNGRELPKTVAFTSGLPGKCQYLLQVPQEYWNAIATRKFKTEPDETGKKQQVELRWNFCQSILPPSVHPVTGQYKWVEGCSPAEREIAPAPSWLIELMLVEPATDTETQTQPNTIAEIGKAKSYLAALSSSRADDYDEWLAVGMALHSVDDCLLKDWEDWSQQSSKYKPGDCQSKWESFKRKETDKRITIASLGQMAIADGWKSNAKLNRFGNRSLEVVEQNKSNDTGITTKVLTIEAAVDKAREILKARHPEIQENILLEKIREQCGLSSYCWEQKFIKPLKRELSGERFKLDLLRLLAIDDDVERLRQQAVLAPLYQMSAGNLEKALQLTKQRTTTPQARSYSLDEFFDLETEGLTWLIPELLPKGETVILAGPPKSGKTLLAIDAAFAIATGESNFLSETVEPGRVLIISVDESARSTQAKLKKRGFRRSDAPNVEIMTQFDIRQMKVLEERLEVFRPHLVIIDSLRRINHGQEISENSAEFADNVYTLKETLGRFNASGILIHHSNKNQEALGVGRLRGSSAIAGAVSSIWQLDHVPKPDPHNKKKLIIDPKDPRRILSVFARDTEGQQIEIELDLENNSWIKRAEVGESAEQSQERATLKTRILDVLKRNTHHPGLSGKEIIELLGIAQEEGRSVYNALNRLVSQRVVTCKPAPGDKRFNLYSLPDQSPPTPPDDSGGNDSPGDSPNCSNPTKKEFLHPPSPTPIVPIDDYCAEIDIEQAIPIVTKLVTNSHQLVTNSHQLSNDDCMVTNSNSYTASNSDIVTKLVTTDYLTGGEGIESKNLELVTNLVKPEAKLNLLKLPSNIESDRQLVQLVEEDGKQKLEVNESRLDLHRPRGLELGTWQPTLEVKPYEQLRRMVIDIETTGLNPNSDRIAAIGAKLGGEVVIISHQDEALILKRFNSLLNKWQPDVIAAHNGMNFDYPFITRRCIEHNIKSPFRISDRESCLRATRVNGKPIVYREVYAGSKKTNLIDTYHLLALYDYSARQLTNLKLKSAVLELGLRKEARLELSAEEIKAAWLSGNSALITKYLQYDLDDCEMLLDCFLPQYHYQGLVTPGMSLQQLVLRGNASKWQKILQGYYGKSPEADVVPQCEGAARFAAQAGIFTNVASVDIASLYPSIQQRYGVCSAKDPDKYSLRVLQYLTVERLRLKKLGKSGDLEAKRQSDALKILLNSLTGMLGTNSIGFNDPTAFSLVTAYGRAILKLMAKTIEECGGQVCFGDTDGIAFTAPDIPGTYAKIVATLPDGIKLDPYEVWDALFIPSGKGEEGARCTYIYWKNGEPNLKGGRYTNRDNPLYLREYEIGFLSAYSNTGLAVAQNFHDDFIARLSLGEFPVEQLSCRRIVQQNSKFKHLGEVGQKVRYWIGEGGTYTNEESYDCNHYIHQIELLHWELLTTLGHEQPKPNKRKKKVEEPSLFELGELT